MQKRLYNYDWLRVVSAFMVVLIHVNAHYFVEISTLPSLTSWDYVIESIFNIISRFSVPCFVMLSGAFNINEKNKDYKYFYLKIAYKIILPFFIIATILLVITEISMLLGMGIVTYSNYITPIKQIFSGSFMNLWFMYMILGLYILTPVVVRFKESVSTKIFIFTSIIWLLISLLSQSTSEYRLAYSFGVIFSFLAYYMLGNIIYEKMKPIKHQWILCVFIACLVCLTFFVRYKGFDKFLFNAYTNFFSPTIILISISIFALFSGLKIKRRIEWLADYTYNIYLFHTMIYLILFRLLKDRIIVSQSLTIIIISCITFLLSFICAKSYKLVWQFFEKKYSIRDKFNVVFEHFWDMLSK